MSSKFPGSWKFGKIVPIPKNSSPKSAKDLRPICILPGLSKALERIMCDQINSYLSDEGLISTSQSGFRKHHSTETALLKVSDDLISHLDNRSIAILTLLDFSKAFDLVDHDVLRTKLSSYFGFSDQATNLVYSYLSNRFHCVVIDEYQSRKYDVKTGVPQGSVLGPLLFCLFINDLPSVIKYCKVHMYADDVQIYNGKPAKNLSALVREINEDIESITTWVNRNKLQLNRQKTIAILFSLSNNDLYRRTAPPIVIDGVNIEYSTTVRNLGLVFDSNFSWMSHINSVCSKVYGCLRTLWPSFSFTSVSLREKLFNSLILPHISYCGAVLGCISAGGLQKIKKALNSCARYVFGISRYDHISHHTKKLLGFEPKQYYSFLICKLIHRILTNKSPDYLYNMFNFGRSNRVQQLVLPRNRSDVKNSSFFVYGVKQYNSLGNRFKTMSCNLFKNECRKFYSNV